MHQELHCIFHRDIRWPTVIKLADDPRKWISIDWDDAGTPPTLAEKHLDPHNHAPAVLEDNHGSEVDVWGVGLLIKDSSRSMPGFTSELLGLGKAMQSGTLDVPECIERIIALKAVCMNAAPCLKVVGALYSPLGVYCPCGSISNYSHTLHRPPRQKPGRYYLHHTKMAGIAPVLLPEHFSWMSGGAA